MRRAMRGSVQPASTRRHESRRPEVIAQQRASESDEARLARIRERAPDTAEMVIEGRLTLKGAEEEIRGCDAEIRLRAERKAGQLLRRMEKAKGAGGHSKPPPRWRWFSHT
jgi:hypothetical protein